MINIIFDNYKPINNLKSPIILIIWYISTYTYDVANRLSSETINGVTKYFYYDALGNITTYKGSTSSSPQNLYWTRGNMLASGNIKDNKTFSYKYDPSNLRYSKTVNNVETVYYWDDGVLVGERTGNNYIQYIYDADGIAGMRYNDAYYYFEKNLFGDILRVYDVYGSIVAEFKYDSYGNIISSSGSFVNNVKFRYRGYYYDDETGFYYLQSRYYDPSLCRFISADQYELLSVLSDSLGEINLYSYCGNDPVNRIDTDGCNWDWNKFWGWVVTSVITVAAVAAIVVVVTGTVASGGLLGSVLVGAGVGALVGMGGSIIAQGGFKNANPWQVAKAGAIGAIIGGVSGAASYGVGTIGEFFGQQFGLSLSDSTHLASGIKFGKIFSTQFLMGAGKVVGGTIGGIVGGTTMNYYANKIVGNPLDVNQTLNQGFSGEIPLWLVKFFHWVVA